MVRLCWVGITCIQKHTRSYTQPLYHSAYIDLFEIISAIITMYDSLCKKPLAPLSRMLANKHVLYVYTLCVNAVFFHVESVFVIMVAICRAAMEAHCYHFVSAYCAPARENERTRKRTKVRENEETKGRENEKTRKRGNEKTKLRNLNPLPLQSIHFVIACISFCFLALFWERTQKWPTVMQDNLIYYI